MLFLLYFLEELVSIKTNSHTVNFYYGIAFYIENIPQLGNLC